MRSVWFTRADVGLMISYGIIADAKSAAAYTLLLLKAMTSPILPLGVQTPRLHL